MHSPILRSALPWLVTALAVCAPGLRESLVHQDRPALEAQAPPTKATMQIHYLEIVTPDMDATCGALEKLHGVTFGKPEADLGNARTAALAGGGRIGVRAPMHAAEQPVVRPYLLVDDIEVAVAASEAAGSEIMLPPTEIPGRGRFAIYTRGGIQHGLWQL